MKHSAILLALCAALLPGCSDHDKPRPKKEPERPRRVVEPPSRGVRALPPHAIRADGVGPYKLGASTSELLDQLPSGPRIQQFSIPGVVHRDMLHGEDDAILIGTEPQGKAMFVAVVRGEIARTEAGIQVGSTREELERSLGAPLDELDRARDPRIVIPSKLDNAHVVLDGERIGAIVLTPPIERTKDTSTAADRACARPASDPARHAFGACLVTGELVRGDGEELAVLAKDADKVVTSVRVPGLVFAAALRNPFDGRDDVVALTRSDDGQTRTWSLLAFRLIDGKLMRVIEPSVLYQVTAGNARFIGAELDQVDLLLELVSKADAIEVGGMLTARTGQQIRDIVMISPVAVPRRRGKGAAPELLDAGLSDGGTHESGAPAPTQGSGSPEHPHNGAPR